MYLNCKKHGIYYTQQNRTMHGYVSPLVTKTAITIGQSWWHSLATVHPTTTLPDLSCAGVNKLEAGVGLTRALLV